jgi:hypothetical protein
MPTPAQRSATYRAQQRTLLGDVAYRAQQSAQRQARRMNVRIINNPQLIPQVPALPVNILQPQVPIVPIAIAPPTIPPRPNAQKLKQLLQVQKPPPIPPRPKKQPPTIPPTPQKPIQQQTPIKEPPKFKSRLNVLLSKHKVHGQHLNIPDEYNKHPAKNNIRDDVKETTLKQYNNKVLNFYNKFYKEQLGEIPNNKTPVSKNYNEWLYDKKLFLDIKTAYDKPDTQRALTTAILSLVERDKLYENENKLKNGLRTLQLYFQKQANEKKN